MKATKFEYKTSHKSVLLNSRYGPVMTKWCGGFFANRHRQFVKKGLP